MVGPITRTGIMHQMHRLLEVLGSAINQALCESAKLTLRMIFEPYRMVIQSLVSENRRDGIWMQFIDLDVDHRIYGLQERQKIVELVNQLRVALVKCWEHELAKCED